MDPKEKRELMMKHYREPKNKGFIDGDGYILNTQNNASCIDEVKLMTKIKDGKIVDIRFDGEACAVCTASTSIMIETLLNKSVTDAKKIVKNFENMIDGKEYDKTSIENAIIFEDIGKQPSRKKCALLAWWGMDETLAHSKEGNDYEYGKESE